MKVGPNDVVEISEYEDCYAMFVVDDSYVQHGTAIPGAGNHYLIDKKTMSVKEYFIPEDIKKLKGKFNNFVKELSESEIREFLEKVK